MKNDFFTPKGWPIGIFIFTKVDYVQNTECHAQMVAIVDLLCVCEHVTMKAVHTSLAKCDAKSQDVRICPDLYSTLYKMLIINYQNPGIKSQTHQTSNSSPSLSILSMSEEYLSDEKNNHVLTEISQFIVGILTCLSILVSFRFCH